MFAKIAAIAFVAASLVSFNASAFDVKGPVSLTEDIFHTVAGDDVSDDGIVSTECVFKKKGTVMVCAPTADSGVVARPLETAYECPFTDAAGAAYDACYAKGREFLVTVETPADYDILRMEASVFLAQTLADDRLEQQRIAFFDDLIKLGDKIYGTNDFQLMQDFRKVAMDVTLNSSFDAE